MLGIVELRYQTKRERTRVFVERFNQSQGIKRVGKKERIKTRRERIQGEIS